MFPEPFWTVTSTALLNKSPQGPLSNSSVFSAELLPQTSYIVFMNGSAVPNAAPGPCSEWAALSAGHAIAVHSQKPC
jgi:hypothetical protein